MKQRFKNVGVILHFAFYAILHVMSESKMKVYWKREAKIVSLHIHCYNHLSDSEIKQWQNGELP